MKKRSLIFIFATHLLLFGLGWSLFQSVSKNSTAKTTNPHLDTSSKQKASPQSSQTSRKHHHRKSRPAPDLSTAGPENFRAVWQKILTDSPGFGNQTFYLEWASLYPEDALLGLTDLYSPDIARNFLSLAIQNNGPEMAELLVKHWAKFSYIPAYKLNNYISNAFKSLGKEDLEKAFELVAKLPPGIRTNSQFSVIQNQPIPVLEKYLKEPPAYLRNASAQEQSNYWSFYAQIVARANEGQNAAHWIKLCPNEESVRSLSVQMLQRAKKFETEAEFLNEIQSLDGETKAWALNALEKNQSLSE